MQITAKVEPKNRGIMPLRMVMADFVLADELPSGTLLESLEKQANSADCV